MNFLKQLKGPELKPLKLKPLSLDGEAADEDVRSTGLSPQLTMQPTTQWLAAPAPDGSDTFTPFKFGKLTAAPTANRRFGPNDESSTNQ